jgi:hypothetical protein
MRGAVGISYNTCPDENAGILVKFRPTLTAIVCLVGSWPACADEVMIPRGTIVFGELAERVTSNSRRSRVGSEVEGQVWRDVVVGGRTIISAGTPIVLRVSRIVPRNVGGRGGSIEIMAVSVKAVDGTEVSLEGGYDQMAGDRYGLTRALSMVFWPTAFLPGRRAVLDIGTVFDASIPANTYVEVPDEVLPTLDLTRLSDLSVEILYDEFDQREGLLPLELTLCDQGFVQRANVTSVNEQSVRPIIVTIVSRESQDSCYFYTGRINLEDLSKHFSRGINRFTVTMAEATADVILNVEM